MVPFTGCSTNCHRTCGFLIYTIYMETYPSIFIQSAYHLMWSIRGIWVLSIRLRHIIYKRSLQTTRHTSHHTINTSLTANHQRTTQHKTWTHLSTLTESQLSPDNTAPENDTDNCYHRTRQQTTVTCLSSVTGQDHTQQWHAWQPSLRLNLCKLLETAARAVWCGDYNFGILYTCPCILIIHMWWHI